MKKLILACFVCTLALGACSKKEKEVVPVQTPAQSLITRLQHLQDSGKVAFGHHDDLAYGYRWAYAPDSSDVKNVTGDYPAIVSWDLGLLEVDSAKNLDGVPFDFMRENIKKHHERGGINTLSWHLLNPATMGNSWDRSDTTVMARVTTEGDALNDTIKVWAARAAEFVSTLRDSEGNLIPVIFRPWHEHTGTWFWWGEGIATPEQLQQLWKITREAFDAKGLDNVVWAYSPDKSNCDTVEDYMAAYPGDEYIDIMGADVYYFGDTPVFNEWMSRTLGFATQMAKEHGKIVALTETGYETIPDPTWYTNILYPAVKDYPIAYIVVWRNAMPEMKENHYYAPYTGHPSAPDFVEFYNMPQTAFLNDIKYM